METQFPIKHKILQSSRFQIYAKAKFPVEEHEDDSVDWQQRVKLPITVATRAKSPRFQSLKNIKIILNLFPQSNYTDACKLGYREAVQIPFGLP